MTLEKADRESYRQTDRQTDGQTDRQIDRQNRQITTARQTDKSTLTYAEM